MKKILIIPLLLLTLGITSCKKEGVSTGIGQNDQSLVQDNKISVINPGMFLFGTCDDWAITLFKKNKVDQTFNYKSLKFTFCPDNTVILSNDILSVSGNWYFLMEKGNAVYLVLNFNAPNEEVSDIRLNAFWADLGGVWKVVQLQRNLVKLQNDIELKQMIFERQLKLY